jgi:hypothetical protein
MADQGESKRPPDVVVGIPCNKDQCPDVWSRYLSLRVPEKVVWFTSSGALTDKSRNEIAKWFLGCGSEWLLFLDDDVAPEPDTLQRLMAHGKEFVTGVYYRRRPPCDPLMYVRTESGWYAPPLEWPEGALLKVDAVGLGCALINRSVFERILGSHVMYERTNGSLGLAHLGDVHERREWVKPGLRIVEPRGVELVQQVNLLRYQDLQPNQQVPFFAFEYGRTEDFYFCELCARAGVEVWVDTSIELYHWGYNRIGREQFAQAKAYLEAQDTAGQEKPQYKETRTEEG